MPPNLGSFKKIVQVQISHLLLSILNKVRDLDLFNILKLFASHCIYVLPFYITICYSGVNIKASLNASFCTT